MDIGGDAEGEERRQAVEEGLAGRWVAKATRSARQRARSTAPVARRCNPADNGGH